MNSAMQTFALHDLFGMTQLINVPTRVTLDSSTFIDHTATTNCNNIVESGVLEIKLSGHYLVYCIRKLIGGLKYQHKCITSLQPKHLIKMYLLCILCMYL